MRYVKFRLIVICLILLFLTSGAYAGYFDELSRFNNSLVASKKYTSVGIVMMDNNPRDRDTIIALFGSKVAKMSSDAGSAAADLLKPANWAKLYRQGAVRYFFQDNKDVMIDVSLVARTLENQGKIGFVIAYTSSWGVDSYKVYALTDNYQFTRVDASGPQFVRREGTLKKLIGDFSWYSLPTDFRNKFPSDMK